MRGRGSRPLLSREPWVFLSAAAVLASGCAGKDAPLSRHTVAMDTYVSITLYDRPANAQSLMDAALRDISRVELMASDYADTSEIGRVNEAAGVAGVAVSPELEALVTRAVVFGRDHNSAFNIALGPLVRRWNFLSDSPAVPTRSAVDSLLPLTDLRRVRTGNGAIHLGSKGMRLDLGGIAKGYAVDRALRVLAAGGSRRAIVDIGGNLGIMWEGAAGLDSGAALIRIRHPRREGEFFGHFAVGTAGVSTSGDYQRYFINNGKRYHHILDPATGFPASDLVSVTVVAPDAETADAYSTLVFVLGRGKGMELIRSSAGIEGIVVFEEGDSLAYHASPGFARRFVREGPHD